MEKKSALFSAEILLILLSLVPVVLLLVFGPGVQSDFSSLSHFFGQSTALIGVTLFALTFVLSTRMKIIEDFFGGLDKVYIAHAHLGGAALILILFHPILLVLKFIPDNWRLAATYLLPAYNFWSVNFGVIALLGMILLIIATLYIKMKYHRWKLSHGFLGLVFIFALLHIFLVRGDVSRDYIFKGYYIYTTIIAIIGLSAFFYTILLKRMKSWEYSVKTVNKIGSEIYEITLAPKKQRINFRGGQFIFVKFFSEGLPKEAHPFSIAAKGNTNIRIFVKKLGDYTGRLDSILPGDKAKVEGPYGKFYSNTNTKKVWIAGGIGITPFLGMAQDLPDGAKVDLVYTVKEENDLVGADELKKLGVNVIPWVSSKDGRLTIDAVIAKTGPINGKEFYICGPKPMMDALVGGLFALKVPRQKIHWEDFAFK